MVDTFMINMYSYPQELKPYQAELGCLTIQDTSLPCIFGMFKMNIDISITEAYEKSNLGSRNSFFLGAFITFLT